MLQGSKLLGSFLIFIFRDPLKLIICYIFSSENLTLHWAIPNFTSHVRKNDYIISPPFIPVDHFKLTLRLYPNGFSEADKGLIIFVHLLECGDLKQLNILYSLSVLDTYGIKRCVKEVKGVFVKDCQFGFPDYIRRNYLLDPGNKLLPNDVLTIYCEVCFW